MPSQVPSAEATLGFCTCTLSPGLPPFSWGFNLTPEKGRTFPPKYCGIWRFGDYCQRLFFGWHLTFSTLHVGQGLSTRWQRPRRRTARSALPLPSRQERLQHFEGVSPLKSPSSPWAVGVAVGTVGVPRAESPLVPPPASSLSSPGAPHLAGCSGTCQEATVGYVTHKWGSASTQSPGRTGMGGDAGPTSSGTMTRGYLSSDRKLKRHQSLKASWWDTTLFPFRSGL